MAIIMDNSGFQKYIDLFRPVMEAMHSLLGESSEFILHDLRTPQSSVAVVVGDVTHRQIGAPTTNLVMKELKRSGDKAENMLDYLSLAKDGRQLKSSTVFIRDDDGKIIGCFCYNLDMTEFRIAEKIITNLCAIKSTDEKVNKGEIFAQEISEVVEDIIQYEINHFGKPVPHMARADKLKLVAILESKGIFDVKGSADMVAHFLGSSVFTIYNYLKEVRNGYKDGV